MSNTATVAMLLPTAIAILGTLANIYDRKTDESVEIDPTRLRVGIALMLMLAYGASVGGLLTPVGSPPNLIGRGLIEEATGEKISFLEWVLAALPICALMFVALCAILLTLNKPEVKRLEGVEEYVAEEREKLGPMSRKEKNTLIAFGVAVTLWIAPGIVAIIAGDESKIYEDVTGRLDEGIVADPRRVAAVPAPDQLGEARVHADVERGEGDRLGHDPALRLGHHLRRAARGHRAGGDDRQLGRRHLRRQHSS